MSIVKKEGLEFGKIATATDKRGKLRLKVGTDKYSRFIAKESEKERASYGSVFRSVWDSLLNEKAALPTEPKQIAFARKLILDNEIENAKVLKGSDLSRSEITAIVTTALMGLFNLQFKQDTTVSVLTDLSKFQALLNK